MAYCTDRADSDGCGTGKKKALVWLDRGRFKIRICYSYLPHYTASQTL